MEAGIALPRFATALMAMLLLSLLGVQETEASPADGAWLIKDLVLDIFDCQRLVCGRIIWIGDAARRTHNAARRLSGAFRRKARTNGRVVRSSILMMTKHTG